MTPAETRGWGPAADGWTASRILFAIAGLSVVLRVSVAIYMGSDVSPMPGVFDQVSYHGLAVRVLDGHGFSFGVPWWPATPANAPTAHWSFLYVLYLAGTYALAGPSPVVARVAQAAIVGVLQPVLVYRIAGRLFDTRIALVSALLVSVYAYFVYYAGALVTESFYIVAMLWSVDAALRASAQTDVSRRTAAFRPWLELGLALGVAVLLRQVMLLVVPIVLGWAVWRARHARGRESTPGLRGGVAGAAAAALVIVACVLPWTIRNYRVFDQVVLLNTNAGFAFFWGNHPVHGTRFVPLLPGEGSYGRLIPEELRGLNEGKLDRELLVRGVGFVLNDPARYLRLSIDRSREYFKFWPAHDSSVSSNLARVLSFGLYLPLFALGATLALAGFRRARAGTGLVLSLALAYTLIHLLTWTLIRYRLPVDALLMPFAGLAATRLADRVLSQSPERVATWAREPA